MNQSLIVMIKPTNACNLRCLYCYHAEYEYSNSIMVFSVFESLLKMAKKEYSHLHLIWHGGEPLMPSISFYQKIMSIEESFASNSFKITNSMQSNGTLLTPDFSDFLTSNNIQLGFSFDGATNDAVRGKAESTINGMQLMREHNKRIGAIKVMLKDDLTDIISVYNYFKSISCDLKLNPLFKCELVQPDMLYTPQEYAEALKKLFYYWVNDAECNIIVNPFNEYLALLSGTGKRTCSHSSCMTKFLSIDHNGDFYPCSRYYPPTMCLGNIKNISKISELFQSEAFISLLSSAITRRETCKNNCMLFPYCQGGCNHDALTDGHLDKSGFFSCLVFKQIFPIIKNYFESTEISCIKNPQIKKQLRSTI